MEEKIVDTVGTCYKVVFSKDSFMIALFSTDIGDISVKGNMYVSKGQKYKIKAVKDDSNPKYNNSYKGIQVRLDVNLDEADDKVLHSFLASFLTERQTKEILSTLPNPIEVFENGDIEKLVQVKGIGVASAERIINNFQAQKDYSEAFVFFADYDISEKLVKKICDHFGSVNEAIAVTKANVYDLLQVGGIGFKKADWIFLSNLEHDPNDIRRVKAFTKHIFEEAFNEGHTWLSPQQYVEAFNEQFYNGNFRDGVDHINESPEYTTITAELPDGTTQKRICLTRVYQMEVECVMLLNELIESESKLKFENVDEIIHNIEESQGWEYTDEQKSAIQNMLDHNLIMLQGLSGAGKAQPVDIEIPTPDGYKKLGDIRVGDYVFDRKGKPTKVINVYPQGMKDNYEITFSDGRRTWCNDEHLWTTFTSKGNLKTRTLREMLDMGLYHGTQGLRNSKFRIQMHEAVEYPEQQYDVDPYVVGAFIGDGGCTSVALSISSVDEDVVAEVSRLLGDGHSYKKMHDKNHNWQFEYHTPKVVHRVSTDGKSLNIPIKYLHTQDVFSSIPEIRTLAHKKRIPERYMRGSVEQRFALLQGLFDTDGTIGGTDGGRYNVRYSTMSEGLAYDIREVLLSLGMVSTVTKENRKDSNKNNGYNISVNISNDDKYKLFRNTNKRKIAEEARGKSKHRKYDRVGIRDVKKLDNQAEMVCIEVDNDEHLYLTNDYIVTHNTSSSNAFLSVLQQNGYSYMAGALSGKAADNLSQVTGQKANTIHSTLQPRDDGFYYGNKNKLPTNAFLLDELSMVNLEIFLALLRAIPRGAKLIMLGDFGQLEAIGVGVMGAFIKSKKVPMILLKKIHRQAQKSAIITHSIDYRNGRIPKELDFNKIEESSIYGENEDLEYIFLEEESKIGVNTLVRFKDMLNVYDIKDIQILCSTKKTGAVSTRYLNENAQRIANPPSLDKPELQVGFKDNSYVLRLGDKVINTKNTRDALAPDGQNRPIFNGNTGIIKEIDASDNSMIIDFDGIGEVVITSTHLNDIELGYAMTIHKCVTGDTWVITNKGFKQLKDLNNGAKPGEFKEISDDIKVFNGEHFERPSAFYNNGVDKVREFKTQKGYSITATHNHGIDVWRKGGLVRVNASELQEGDKLAISLGDEKYGDNTSLPDEWGQRSHLNSRTVLYNRPNELTLDLAKFIGYLCADGTIHDSAVKFSKRHHEVTLDFREVTKRIFGYYKDHLPKRESGDYMYEVTSRDIVDFCRNIEGLQPHNKFVPSIIMEAPKEYQCAFLKGFFEDGSVNVKNGRFDHIEISAKEELLINQVHMMLLNMGILSTKRTRITYDKKYEVARKLHYLYIYKYDAQIFDKHIGFVSHPKNDNLSLCHVDFGFSRKHSYEIVQHPHFGDLFLDEIKHINEFEDQTYCLEMPLTHKFIQNGIHAYNCQGSTIKCVLLALPYHFLLNSKELLYTGMTRAKDYQIIVTTPKALKAAVKKSNATKKNVNIDYLLVNYEKIKNK